MKPIPAKLLLQVLQATPEQGAAFRAWLEVMGGVLEVSDEPKLLESRSDLESSGESPRKEKSATASADAIHRVGRLAYRNDFADVWLGEEHFNLSRRAKARACLRFLVEHRAFDVKAARDLAHEIDPYVRAQCQLPELPGYGELKIHHYFNPSKGDVARLGRELIRPAGRNGRYFLNVN